MSIFECRQHQIYDDLIKESILADKTSFNVDIKLLERIAEKSGTKVIYDNQVEIGKQIVETFQDPKKAIILVMAPPQCGKTGSMCSGILQYINHPRNEIPIANIYIITGLSSVEWKDQTRERFPKIMTANIFHQAELPRGFANTIKEKSNLLIILDEVQIACKSEQSISKAFKNAGLTNENNEFDIQTLYKKDIKIVNYSATPDAVGFDIAKWGDASHLLVFQPPNFYTSFDKLFTENRIEQAGNLCHDNDEIRKQNIEQFADAIRHCEEKAGKKLFHLVRKPPRTEHGVFINLIKMDLGIDCDYMTFYADSELSDINEIVGKEPPMKHTIIIVKEKLRCAKTISKFNLGVLYERIPAGKVNDTAMVQGFAGRLCGYDDNGYSIVFTNSASLETFRDAFACGFSNTAIPWNSTTTKVKNNKTVPAKTFVNTSEDGSDTSSTASENVVPIYREFSSYELRKKYFDEIVKPLMISKGANRPMGPKEPKTKVGEFYTGSLRKKAGEPPAPLSTQYIEANKKWGFKPEEPGFRAYVGYTDLTDPSTIKYCLIYYE